MFEPVIANKRSDHAVNILEPCFQMMQLSVAVHRLRCAALGAAAAHKARADGNPRSQIETDDAVH
jgi:hypothetical protein